VISWVHLIIALYVWMCVCILNTITPNLWGYIGSLFFIYLISYLVWACNHILIWIYMLELAVTL
jgi:hypothetical protein